MESLVTLAKNRRTVEKEIKLVDFDKDQPKRIIFSFDSENKSIINSEYNEFTVVKASDDFSQIEALEKKLLDPATRKSASILNELLAEDFKEFSKSGLVYNKQDILRRLPTAAPIEFNAKHFEVKLLEEDTYLITFRTLENGVEVLRSSIWKSIDGRMQMLFHQGTEVRGMNK